MNQFPSKHPWLGLIGFVVLCFAAAGLGGIATSSQVGTWYAALKRPDWTPPDALFGPVWTVLYLMIATSGWLVWRQGGIAHNRWPLALFGVQLFFNAAWSPLFFGLHRPGLALADIVLLWLSIAATIAIFWRRSVAAALMLLPYWAWVSFACALNFAIWRLNA